MVIRMRHTRSHTKNRRSHHALKETNLSVDKETGVPHLRHRASLETGKYRGRVVIDTASKVIKKHEAKSGAETKVEKSA